MLTDVRQSRMYYTKWSIDNSVVRLLFVYNSTYFLVLIYICIYMYNYIQETCGCHFDLLF